MSSPSGQLSAAADQAGNATQQVATGTAQQTESVNVAAGNVNQLTRAIDGLAQSARERGAAGAAETAHDGAASVQQTIHGRETIRNSTELVAQKVP